jgi:hypothetical protein
MGYNAFGVKTYHGDCTKTKPTRERRREGKETDGRLLLPQRATGFIPVGRKTSLIHRDKPDGSFCYQNSYRLEKPKTG